MFQLQGRAKLGTGSCHLHSSSVPLGIVNAPEYWSNFGFVVLYI